ncbi:chitin binding peritrophin-A domain-containing protein [Chitinophaga solisilvae]
MTVAVLLISTVISNAEVVGDCANEGQYLADSKDCTIFYVCDAMKKPQRHDCPPGLEYDCIRQICNYPDSVPGNCPCKK